jgi:hypothetical protein
MLRSGFAPTHLESLSLHGSNIWFRLPAVALIRILRLLALPSELALLQSAASPAPYNVRPFCFCGSFARWRAWRVKRDCGTRAEPCAVPWEISRFDASLVGLWTFFSFVRMVIGCLGARASGCLQMSRYRGSEGGLALVFCGLGMGGGLVGCGLGWVRGIWGGVGCGGWVGLGLREGGWVRGWYRESNGRAGE